MALRIPGSVVLSGLLLASCALFDSGTPWKSGKFALLWIDLPEEVELSYDQGNGSWSTLVEPRVFAVGSSADYVVAQQHPGGDTSVTNYFIVEVRRYVPGHSTGIIGPLTAAQFEARSKQLGLPPFTTVLTSLR